MPAAGILQEIAIGGVGVQRRKIEAGDPIGAAAEDPPRVIAGKIVCQPFGKPRRAHVVVFCVIPEASRALFERINIVLHQNIAARQKRQLVAVIGILLRERQERRCGGKQIDQFGVGERLITARSEPVFGGVYKLAAVEDENGNVIPKIKVSENVGKITNPHFKKLYRFFGADNGKAIADYLCVYDETVDDTKDLEIFDPDATWKRKKVYNFQAKELMVPIFKNGELVYKLPSLPEIKAYCQQQIDTLWDEVKRFDNPHTYYVDLSQKLWQIKYDLLREKTF